MPVVHKRSYLTVIAFLASITSAISQEISSIRISTDEKFVSWVRNRDSLMIGDVESSTIKFVTAGLSDNGNQRFMNWVSRQSMLLFEKGENLYSVDPRSGIFRAINHDRKDQLNLFLWYLIGQTSVHADHVYFSAGVKKSDDKKFQLQQLNLENGKCISLATHEWNIGNVSVSSDGKWVAYAAYTYEGRQCKSVICLYDAQGSKVVHQTEPVANFITELRWNADVTSLVAVDDQGMSRLYTHSGGKLTESSKETLPYRIVDFIDDSTVLASVVSDQQSEVVSIDLRSKERRALFPKSRFVQRRGAKLFVATELDHEILVRRADVGNFEKSEVIFRIPKSAPPPIQFKQLSYENGAGEMSSAFLLEPESKREQNPLVVIPYGGYSSPVINHSYFLHKEIYGLVKKGYAVCFPNTRGINSEEQREKYGKYQLEDTERLVNQLIKSENIDPKKIFVMGHSHGATMVYYFLTHSDLFAGGIAVNGAADWIKQAELKSMAGLPFGMGGDPGQKMSEYNDASPLNNMHKLKVPLLIIAGKHDKQIPYEINSSAFYAKAKSLGKDVKLVAFEEEGHLLKETENIEAFWKEVDVFLTSLFD